MISTTAFDDQFRTDPDDDEHGEAADNEMQRRKDEPREDDYDK